MARKPESTIPKTCCFVTNLFSGLVTTKLSDHRRTMAARALLETHRPPPRSAVESHLQRRRHLYPRLLPHEPLMRQVIARSKAHGLSCRDSLDGCRPTSS